MFKGDNDKLDHLFKQWTVNSKTVTYSNDISLYHTFTLTDSQEIGAPVKHSNCYTDYSNMTPLMNKETRITSLSKVSSSSSSLSSSPSSSSSLSSYTHYRYESDYLHANFVTDSTSDHNNINSTPDKSTTHSPSLQKYSLNSQFLYRVPQEDRQIGDRNINQIDNEMSNKFLIYRDDNLISGDFSSLVQHLVPTMDYYPDRAYIFTFLLTSRFFTTPYELFVNVVALCNTQQNITTEKSLRLSHFVTRLMRLIKEWSELFPQDFQDENLLNYARAVMDKCIILNENLRDDMNNLLTGLIKKVCILDDYEHYIATINANSTVDSISSLEVIDITELCPNPRVLAECLCHVELNRLAHISPVELVQEFSKNKNVIESFYKTTNRLQAFKAYIEWFNRLSSIVCTEICKQARKKDRVKVIEYFVEAGRECFNIGNFNSLMAIISALNMSPIVRLKKTWHKVQSGKFAILVHQMDPTSNFSSYRSTLKAAMWRSAGTTDKNQQIVIPFFSLYMKDIYFLNECCVNRLPNGHINFEKFWHLAKQVTEFMTWKQVSCPFQKNEEVISFLQECPVLSDNSLLLASFEFEQPDGNVEKDQYKSLKSDIHQ